MNKKFGIVFPGQGSQRVGMLLDIAKEYPIIHSLYDEASAILGYDLWRLVAEGPEDQLNQTCYTQPALLVASYALWQIITEKHQEPGILAGHSLGECTALLCAGAFDFPDAIRLVAARAQYMEDAVPAGTGGLAAIVGLSEAMVSQICQEAQLHENDLISPANFNSHGQVVIAGYRESLMRALKLAKQYGAKIAKLLPVSVPSHCHLMSPAADQLGELLDKMSIAPPKLRVINNAEVMPYTDAASIRAGLVKQLYMPVRWVDVINEFINHGIPNIVECGPGKILTGLNRRISAELRLLHVDDLANLKELLDTHAIE